MTAHQATFVYRYTDWIIRFRWPVIVVSTILIVILGTGTRHLEPQQNYRIMFGKDNPQLIAFDELEAVYSKNDNHIILVNNPNGTVFTETTLRAIRDITNAGWQTPHSNRVDSLVNYQHSWSIEDDLMVEDLVLEGMEGDANTIARAERVMRNEPNVAGLLTNHDQDTAIISIRIQLDPDDPDAVGECAAASRELVARMRNEYPDHRFELTGMGMMSNAFGEAPQRDGETVFPLMVVLLLAFMLLFTRSITGTIATSAVIALSAIGAMGASGYYGYGVNPVNIAAPIVILTLAIADSIHILLSMFKEMAKGSEQLTALRESIRINVQPVFLTSLTTAIGFLVMNFSDAPPFHELGNITATGVGLAWALSMTFLPATLAILPIKPNHHSKLGERVMSSIAEINIRNRKKLVTVLGGSIIFFIASISRMHIGDIPHQYIAQSVDFRKASDFFDDKFGFYGFYISVEAEEPGGINDPEYLGSLDRFVTWLRQQEKVTYVGSYVDIAKKLNMNMHGDEPEFRRVPESRELAAQYLLLYEMSLPFGLDLNDQINVDKSGTKLAVNVGKTDLGEVVKLGDAAQSWLLENGKGIHANDPTGPPIMFAHITEANIRSMLRGTALGFGLISIILMISLRSPIIGLLSLIPNTIPAATAFGIWAVFVGYVGFAISVVAGLSIGIIVDDTVHFLSKYSRARREMHLSAEEAVRYAFVTVGQALLSTSFIVAGGFAVLMLSTFRVTAVMGALTSLTVVCALLADFFVLPALLLLVDRRDMGKPIPKTELE